MSCYLGNQQLDSWLLLQASMTGRARGRSRGRSRTTAQEPAPRPGAVPSREEAPQAPQVARGRGRAPAAVPAAAVPPQAAASGVAQVTAQMAAVSVEKPEQRPEMSVIEQPKMPVKKASPLGSYGARLNLRTNYFKLIQKPNFSGFFQYQVTFNPHLESPKLKGSLLKDHAEILGSVRAFDGMVLYLPKKLPELETKLMSTLRRDETSVEITIKYTNQFPFKSPTTIQLMNVIFRRSAS